MTPGSQFMPGISAGYIIQHLRMVGLDEKWTTSKIHPQSDKIWNRLWCSPSLWLKEVVQDHPWW